MSHTTSKKQPLKKDFEITVADGIIWLLKIANRILKATAKVIWIVARFIAAQMYKSIRILSVQIYTCLASVDYMKVPCLKHLLALKTYKRANKSKNSFDSMVHFQLFIKQIENDYAQKEFHKELIQQGKHPYMKLVK